MQLQGPRIFAMTSENKTETTLKRDNGSICSRSTIISMATGGGLVIVLLVALIVVLLKFKREIRQYRRAKSLLANVSQRSQAVGSDSPLPRDRMNPLRTAPINLRNRVSNATQASNESTAAASNCSNRASGDSMPPVTEPTTVEVREKRSSTYEDIEEIQWTLNDLYESSETECYVAMGQTPSNEREKEKQSTEDVVDRVTFEANLEQSSLTSDRNEGRKLPVAEVRPVFQHRTLPSVMAHENLLAKLKPVFQFKTRSLEKPHWYVSAENMEEQSDYQNIARPRALTSEDTSSFYEEPSETCSRCNLVENESNEIAFRAISSMDESSSLSQEDTSTQPGLADKTDTRNLRYDSGSSC